MHRPVGATLALFVALGLAGLAMPRAVAACSCMGQSMDEASARPESVVFVGVVEPWDGRGVPVTVTRWFKGGGLLEPRIRLDPRWMHPDGQGGDCSLLPLPAGAAYIFVADRTDGTYGVHLCSVFAPVASDEGQALIADANRLFGPGGKPSIGADPPTTTPGVDPASIFAATLGALGPLFLVVAFGAGVLLGVVGAIRRMGVGRD